MSVRAVMLGMMAARLGVVVTGVRGVPMRGVRVISRLLVIAALVVLRSLTMVTSGMLVVLSGFVVMLGSLMRRHGFVLLRTAHS